MDIEENKRTRLTALLTTGLVGTFLLAGSAFFYVGNQQLKEENRAKTEQVETLSSVKEKLQEEIKAIDTELSRYKGKNAEMDQLLDSAYKELREKRQRISKLLIQNASLGKYKLEVEELRKMKKNYFSQIQALEKHLYSLSEENADLKKKNEKLTYDLEVLRNNYMLLERKVEIASILKIDNVIAFTEKKTRSGKYSKVSSSKKANRFVINFELSENRVAEPGEKSIYIRVLDPSHRVLPCGANEKGFFTNSDGNLELPYSVQKTIDYKNQGMKSVAIYEIGHQHLQEGAYTIEFYCEGYFCGASKYVLK